MPQGPTSTPFLSHLLSCPFSILSSSSSYVGCNYKHGFRELVAPLYEMMTLRDVWPPSYWQAAHTHLSFVDIFLVIFLNNKAFFQRVSTYVTFHRCAKKNTRVGSRCRPRWHSRFRSTIYLIKENLQGSKLGINPTVANNPERWRDENSSPMKQFQKTW